VQDLRINFQYIYLFFDLLLHQVEQYILQKYKIISFNAFITQNKLFSDIFDINDVSETLLYNLKMLLLHPFVFHKKQILQIFLIISAINFTKAQIYSNINRG